MPEKPRFDFSIPLGDTVKQARERLGLTQKEAAERSDVDNRSILNMENYRANPKMEALYPVVRTLQIDPQDIFFPKQEKESPIIRQLQMAVTGCTEREAKILLPTIKAILDVLRSEKPEPIE